MGTLPIFEGGLNRRDFLKAAGAVGAGLALSPTVFGAPKGGSGPLIYTLVNKTNGKWKDEQCFWSLNGGREWHSFAKEPTVPCPNGGGRMYFYMGNPPENFGDHHAYWDFIEYNYGGGTWYGNTTQVDAFCLPLTIELGAHKMGITDSRTKMFQAFSKEAPQEFKACVIGDFWIVSPCKAGFGQNGPNSKYFEKYIDDVWDMYAKEQQTPSGKYTGKVDGTALIYTPVGGGKAYTCPRKPNTQEAFLGAGILSNSPTFCAAINRHVLADPGDWYDPTKYYLAEPCNWYSKFLHEHTINHKCYGFCYDDMAGQAAYFAGKGDNLIVTFYWD